MLKKAVQQSVDVKRKTLNVKSFGGKALGNPAFHVSPFTVPARCAHPPMNPAY
jgi:hypothetical protein